MIREQEILEYLKDVQHPAKGDKSIIELGMVEKVAVEPLEGEAVRVTVTLGFSKHRDPLAEYLIGSTKAAIIRHCPAGSEAEVITVIKEEPKPKKKPGLDLGLEELANVKHIIGVASGKGGVGKSTVAVNLAVALARLGYKVGLADADVYGPSVPKMTDTENEVPGSFQIPGSEPGEEPKDVIMPIEKYGVKWMSIGYFASPEQALIWRGPMACNALKQMILQVRWGELDFLLIDMPPGTGDVPLTVFQSLPVDGVVVVASPQELVGMIVEKSVRMAEMLEKKVLGLVENMSYFTCPDCGKRLEIFGPSRVDELAARRHIPVACRLPINPAFAAAVDRGAAFFRRPRIVECKLRRTVRTDDARFVGHAETVQRVTRLLHEGPVAVAAHHNAHEGLFTVHDRSFS